MRSFLLAILLTLCVPIVSFPEPLPCAGTVEVFFSPSGGATAAIVREIGMAKTEILIQAYSFTSAPIAKSLIAARKRGVRIEAVLDKSNRSDRYSARPFWQTKVPQSSLIPLMPSPTTKS